MTNSTGQIWRFDEDLKVEENRMLSKTRMDVRRRKNVMFKPQQNSSHIKHMKATYFLSNSY
jgi:hypothetical protein